MDTLKELLFQKTAQALRSYQEAKENDDFLELPGFYGEPATFRHQRFIALYDVIETAELEDEYQSWKETGA